MPSLSSIVVFLALGASLCALLYGVTKLVTFLFNKRSKNAEVGASSKGSHDAGASALCNQGLSSPPKRLISAYSKQPDSKTVEVESVSQVFKGKHRNR